MPVSVRRARLSDAGEIARLTAQLGYDVAASDAAARLSRILSRPGEELLVAELDGRQVGWVHVVVTEFVDADAFGVIGGLVVDRACRREGVGRLLMTHAEEWVARQGCSVVRLWSSTGRADAHRFYEAIGYTNIKTQFSFAKALDVSRPDRVKSLVPRLDE